MKMEVKVLDLDARPRWQRQIAWLQENYGRRLVRVMRAGECVAYLAGPEFAGLIERLARTWHERRPPFTQEALDEWAAEQLAGMDLMLAPDDTIKDAGGRE